ncbi:hypothetical protein CO173_04340 [Candidatus Uhrbacteria bacterium CG_4_9_14_3_um_filter_41_35]|uniref:CARDB domain-containing protein n=1 Tax=Candidatus Uhrbacteria bacterium CG_4_9_14_3_um_filter_41_35 TaxID=1975034 RepID=A0A2M7XD81_9BACT|nr:MAG: hypothetical protein CO173_04340 [Candidatus Uhrbacteria bacterium CG_4_9_14_3_um_filter_41_35]
MRADRRLVAFFLVLFVFLGQILSSNSFVLAVNSQDDNLTAPKSIPMSLGVRPANLPNDDQYEGGFGLPEENLAIIDGVSDSLTEEEIANAPFFVLDEFTDVAEMRDGYKVRRIYSQPRLVFEENGVKKVHSPDWSKFQTNNDSVLAQSEKGYDYQIQLENGTKIGVTAGELENGGTKILPKSVEVKTKRLENTYSSIYSDIYPGIDVTFKDSGVIRERNIVIKERPTGQGVGNDMIFWEEQTLSATAKVFIGEKEVKSELKTAGQEIYIREADGSRLVITPAIIYDGSGSGASHIDINGQMIDMIVRIDRKAGKVYLGLVAPATYLQALTTVYPVTIDPFYYACNEGQAGLSCALTDWYFRTINGASDLSYDSTQLLFGLWKSGATNYTRHVGLKFDVNFQGLSEAVIGANLKMYYRNLGNGTDSFADTTGRRITRSWPTTNISLLDYNTFRGSLVSENPSLKLYTSPTLNWKTWNVTKTVQAWQNGASNYGLIVEQDPAWLSGNVPPTSWEDRLFVFDSGSYAGSTGPYLEITTQTINQPDLYPFNPSIVSRTIEAGGKLDTSVTVRNAGPGVLSSGGVIKYYWTQGTVASYATGNEIGSLSFPALGVYAESQKNFSFTVPPGTAPGNYMLSFWIDPANTIAETSNTITKPLGVLLLMLKSQI